MTWRKTRPADGAQKVRRQPKRLGPVLGLVSVLVVAGLFAGGALALQAGAATARLPITRAEPAAPVVGRAVPTVANPVAATLVPSTTKPATPLTQPPVASTVPVPTTVRTAPAAKVAVPVAPDACAVALAYLAAHAAPGFAHFCRPGSLHTALGPSTAYTCLPGAAYSCPDGMAEIIIADPTCPASYENEASNSYWDFSRAGVVRPGMVQNGRTWDPFGACP